MFTITLVSKCSHGCHDNISNLSVIRRFKGSDAIEICNGITFDFYTGLPQVCLVSPKHGKIKSRAEKEEHGHMITCEMILASFPGLPRFSSSVCIHV